MKQKQRKTEFLVIRMAKPDRDLVARAAAADDLDVSTWARRVVVQAARRWADRSGTPPKGGGNPEE